MKEFPNLSYIDEISGGDNEFQQRFLKLLKEEFLWEVGKYLYHMERQELRSASEMVAKSKYKLRMLGLEYGSILADTHAENLRMGYKERHQDFKNILEKVSAFLQDV